MKLSKKILFLIVINMFINLNVYAASNPYNEKGPYGTNCTWYAWKMANEKSGVSLPGLGDAKNWYKNAEKKGYTVSTTPKANSIIVWGDWTSYGHVGYVEKVEGDTLYVWDSTGPCIDEEDPEYMECMANGVSEESDRICKAKAKRVACKYSISSSSYSIIGYIYLDVAPKKTTTTSKKEEIKSSNAYLKDIEISNGNITFDKNVFEYNLELSYEVESLEVNVTTEDSKSTVKGTGVYELNVGTNEIKLEVSAEDNSKKEYILKVTRKEKIEILKENNEVVKDIEKNDNSYLVMYVLFASIIILLVIVTIVFLLKRHNKNIFG